MSRAGDGGGKPRSQGLQSRPMLQGERAGVAVGDGAPADDQAGRLHKLQCLLSGDEELHEANSAAADQLGIKHRQRLRWFSARRKTS